MRKQLDPTESYIRCSRWSVPRTMYAYSLDVLPYLRNKHINVCFRLLGQFLDRRRTTGIGDVWYCECHVTEFHGWVADYWVHPEWRENLLWVVSLYRLASSGLMRMQIWIDRSHLCSSKYVTHFITPEANTKIVRCRWCTITWKRQTTRPSSPELCL
jgi:hypothetical protein